VRKETASWLYSEKTLARQKTLEDILSENPNHSLKAVYEQPYSINGLAMPSLRETFGLMLVVCQELERA